MSGIAGIIQFDGAPANSESIRRMTNAMASRGPDGINHWVKGSVALGQCMLRTTPESLEENQPLTNEDESLVLVMDGRVDNFEDLRRELLGRGAVLRSRADAELVLRAYEAWGEACPDRIIGEFVFFIWDTRQRRLFGARDVAGTRHFHYHCGKGWFCFASEIKGLLAIERIETRLNESRLFDYFVPDFDYDDQVGTFYQDINRLPAGHAMSASKREVKTWRYWNPGNLPALRFRSMDECSEAFLAQFRVAVKCRLRSIGPVGAMLSGGLDSSSIVGLIRKEFRDDLKQPLQTFSLIREDRENCLEWQHIQEMLKGGWIEPTIITSALPSDLCRPYFDSIPNVNEPFELATGFCSFLVYDAASANGCRVLLDGAAGDLLFYHLDDSLDRLPHRKMISRIPAMLAAHHRNGMNLKQIAWKSLRMVAPHRLRELYRNLREKSELMSGKVREQDLRNFLQREMINQFLASKKAQRKKSLENTNQESDQIFHARYFTSGLASLPFELSEQMAVSKEVELRTPYGDRRLLEFAIQMPLEGKLSAPFYKHLLRTSMEGILPEVVRLRPSIGINPRESFIESLISQMARESKDIWDYSLIDDTVGKWVDMVKFRRIWDMYKYNGDLLAGEYIMKAAILSGWIKANFNSFPKVRL